MRDLGALPKANLHLHLTGSMRPETAADLAARYGLVLPPPLDLAASHRWAEFQQLYDAARAAVRTADDIARIVTEAIADDTDDGAGWLEIQVDPTSYAARLGGLEPVIEAVLGAARGGARGDRTGIILAASWGAPPAEAERVARLAVRYAEHGVVGFGLSNDERRGRVTDFVPTFRITADAGLLGVPHAGFYEEAWHVRDCVRELGAHRIGHGLTAARDPAVLDLLASSGVALEVCPASYPPLGVADLAAVPVKALLASGVEVTLGTDDPLLFRAGLGDLYAIARDQLGLTDAELALVAANGVRASAAPTPVKDRLLAGVRSWLAGF